MRLSYYTPLNQYLAQKGRAEDQRGIPFLLTFEEWWSIWQQSGHWHERGRGREKYCMARFGDTGPYAVDNVKICTNRENAAERQYSASPETRAKLSAAGRARGPISEETRAKHRSYTHTPEQRAKLLAAVKHRAPLSDEVKAKMSAAARRRSPESRIHSPETRAKMAASARKLWRARMSAAAEGAPA